MTTLATAHERARSLAREGWGIVALLSAVCFFTIGGTISCLGFFFDPLRVEFGWSSEHVSSIAGIFLLTTAVATPIVGLLLDRVGARSVMTFALVLAGAGLIYAGHGDSRTTVVAGFALAGAGVAGSAYVPCIFVATSLIETRRRGLAVGLIVGASAAGSALLPLLVSYLIDQYGWRSALIWMGWAFILALSPLVAWKIRTRAYPSGNTGQAVALAGLEVRPALMSSQFWFVASIPVLFNLGFMGIYLHLVPFLVHRGHATGWSAIAFGVMNALSAVAIVLTGLLADSFGVRRVLAISLMLNAATIFLLFGGGGPYEQQIKLATFVGVWGLVQGAPTQLMPMLLAESVGLKRFGSLSGIMGVLTGLAQSAGPMLTGVVLDMTNSYFVAFAGCAALMGTALIPSLLIRLTASDTRAGAKKTSSVWN